MARLHTQRRGHTPPLLPCPLDKVYPGLQQLLVQWSQSAGAPSPARLQLPAPSSGPVRKRYKHGLFYGQTDREAGAREEKASLDQHQQEWPCPEAVCSLEEEGSWRSFRHTFRV